MWHPLLKSKNRNGRVPCPKPLPVFWMLRRRGRLKFAHSAKNGRKRNAAGGCGGSGSSGGFMHTVFSKAHATGPQLTTTEGVKQYGRMTPIPRRTIIPWPAGVGADECVRRLGHLFSGGAPCHPYRIMAEHRRHSLNGAKLPRLQLPPPNSVNDGSGRCPRGSGGLRFSGPGIICHPLARGTLPRWPILLAPI